MAPHGFDHVGAKGDVGDKLPIHDIEVEPIGCLDRFHLFLKTAEVGRQNRRRNLDFHVNTAFQRLLQSRAAAAGTAGTSPHRARPARRPPVRRNRARCGGDNR